MNTAATLSAESAVSATRLPTQRMGTSRKSVGGSTAADLATATPDSRDRYVDLMRLVSIVAVVSGHWLVGLLTVGGDAGLSHAVGGQLVTWIWQVMPLFFFVGGFSHATGLQSMARRGGTVGEFWRSRVARLLPPVLVMVAVWTAAGLVLDVLDLDSGPLNKALNTVAVPLWFIGIYLAVIVTAPTMHRLHTRYGARVLPVLVLMVAGVDAARMGLDMPILGYINYLLVWVAIHQIGFFYADGTLQRAGRKLAAAMTVGGLAGSVLLTLVSGLYPVAMVAMPTDATSNTNPPTAALLTHACWIIGLALLVRPAATRWLQNRRVWTGVIIGNGLMMTIFCWHLTAMLAVAALPILGGLPLPATGSLTWWTLALPAWIIASALVLTGLITVFRRYERLNTSTDRTVEATARGHRLALVGTSALAIGMFCLSQAGFDNLLSLTPEIALGAPMIGSISLATLIAGILALRASGSRRS